MVDIDHNSERQVLEPSRTDRDNAIKTALAALPANRSAQMWFTLHSETVYTYSACKLYDKVGHAWASALCGSVGLSQGVVFGAESFVLQVVSQVNRRRSLELQAVTIGLSWSCYTSEILIELGKVVIQSMNSFYDSWVYEENRIPMAYRTFRALVRYAHRWQSVGIFSRYIWVLAWEHVLLIFWWVSMIVC